MWADRLRAEIRNGTDPVHPTPPTPDPNAELTLRDVLVVYEREHVNAPTRRANARRQMRSHLTLLREIEIPGPQRHPVLLADKSLAAITRADIEAVRQARREAMATPIPGDARRRPGSRHGLVGVNRLLARLRHVFTWSIGAGYIDATPFVRHGVAVVKLDTRAEVSRTRRLLFGEEEALLAAAEPRLKALIVAALATGCRLGELLTLQWSQIRRDAHGQPAWIDLPVERTKTYQARLIPIGMRL